VLLSPVIIPENGRDGTEAQPGRAGDVPGTNGRYATVILINTNDGGGHELPDNAIPGQKKNTGSYGKKAGTIA